MKNLAKLFNAFLNEAGVSASLFFVMLELIGINAYSLHYVLDSQHQSAFNYIPAILGAVAYSITTIVVMQQPNHERLKVILPILDGFLVFLALNLMFIEQYKLGEVNYVAVTLSLLFAIFTAVITLSLGQINSENTEPMIAQHHFDVTSKELDVTLSKLNKSIKSNKFLVGQVGDKDNELSLLKTEFKTLRSEHSYYYEFYIRKEKARIAKKSKANLTEEEILIINL